MKTFAAMSRTYLVLTVLTDRGENALRCDALSTVCPLEVQPKCAIKSSRRLWRKTSQLTTELDRRVDSQEVISLTAPSGWADNSYPYEV